MPCGRKAGSSIRPPFDPRVSQTVTKPSKARAGAFTASALKLFMRGRAARDDRAIATVAATRRRVLVQSLVWGSVLAGLVLGAFLISDAFQARNVTTGFGFLRYPATFDIGESMIAYSGADTYAKALLVGALNTIKVAVVGIVLATFLGLAVCLCRLSSNPLLAWLATAFIELMRNIPPLLQLFVWYAVFYVSLPSPRQALQPLPGVIMSNRGLWIPSLDANGFGAAYAVSMVVPAIIVFIMVRRARSASKHQPSLSWAVSSAILAGLFGFVLARLWMAAPTIDWPVLRGLNYRGGYTITPEFAALTIGLSLYTSGYLAAVFHGAVTAISAGQREAALALGLRPFAILRLIVLPQAVRIAVPPATNQWINLAKNSSLAVAIGYPDFVSVGNTTLSLTGQAVEVITLFMLFYTVLSMVLAILAGLLNRAPAYQVASREGRH